MRFIAAEHEARKSQAATGSAQGRSAAPRLSRFDRPVADAGGAARHFSRTHRRTPTRRSWIDCSDDPRYGERWGRHWMDVWRYSDWAGWTDGNQIRDSKPHIWRWRDWIVESLNADKGYDRMMLEMLAADELAPEDTERAARHRLSRAQLQNAQPRAMAGGHGQAHLAGVSRRDDRLRQVPRPHVSIRSRRRSITSCAPSSSRTRSAPTACPARPTPPRTASCACTTPTRTRRPISSSAATSGSRTRIASCSPACRRRWAAQLRVEPVKLPRLAAYPDKREFVIRDTIAASEKALADARRQLEKLKTNAAQAGED